MNTKRQAKGSLTLRSSTLRLAILAAGAVSLGMSTAQAQIVALDSVRGVGNQAFTGALGMDFDVLEGSLLVSRLGAFDSGQDGFVGSINVGIFDRNTTTLISSATLTTANTVLIGQSRFFDVADFSLVQGQYSIVAQGFSNSDLNGNAVNGGTPPTINDGGGVIDFVGGGRFSTTPALVYPTTIDGGPANRYDAGTFEFTAVAAAAPEPGTFAFLAVGLLPVAGVVVRRRRANR